MYELLIEIGCDRGTVFKDGEIVFTGSKPQAKTYYWEHK